MVEHILNQKQLPGSCDKSALDSFQTFTSLSIPHSNGAVTARAVDLHAQEELELILPVCYNT